MTGGAAARLALALAVSAGGGAVFAALGLPAAWLSGAMVAAALAALSGLSAAVPRRLKDALFLVLGITMGSGVTPEVVGRMAAWPATLAGLAVTMVLVTLASYLFLRRVAGWDPATAYFGSIPGALTMTMAVAETSPADMRRVSLSQTVRLFMLVAVLPLIVAAVDPASRGGGAGPAVADAGDLALLLAGGAAGAAAGLAVRIPSGLLLGAFLASGLLHGTGAVEGQLPLAIQIPAFVLLGALLGLRFSGTTWRQVAGMVVAGVGAFAVATAVAAAGAAAVAALVGMAPGEVLIAFAPGGLEAMVILAFALSVDPAFVAAHHLARFLAMTAAVPAVAPFVYGRTPPPTTKENP